MPTEKGVTITLVVGLLMPDIYSNWLRIASSSDVFPEPFFPVRIKCCRLSRDNLMSMSLRCLNAFMCMSVRNILFPILVMSGNDELESVQSPTHPPNFKLFSCARISSSSRWLSENIASSSSISDFIWALNSSSVMST